MPKYRVYATEEGRTTRAVSVDYIADNIDDAARMYMDWEPFEDYSVDDYVFDMDSQQVDEVQLID